MVEWSIALTTLPEDLDSIPNRWSRLSVTPPSSRGSDTLAQTYEQAKQNKTPMHTKIKINHLKSNHTGSLRQTGNGLFKQNLVEQATSAVL